MADRFTIDVVSDVICPWCFLGKRRLDVALAAAASAHQGLVDVMRALRRSVALNHRLAGTA